MAGSKNHIGDPLIFFACEMNNPDLKYDINPFACFGEHNRSGLLESEGDISTGLYVLHHKTKGIYS